MSARFGRFVLHPDRRQLLRDGAEVHLTPKAFDLLQLLIERSPAVVSKADIHAHLWPTTFVSDATLAGLIKELRRAFGGLRSEAAIRTVHRVGFAFEGARESAGAAPPTAVPAVHWLVAGARKIPLHDGVNVIGRDPDAAIVLDVPGVSRRHAQVILEGGAAALEDLGSKNGTLLGNRPVRGRVPLRDADRIQVASELLVFYTSARGSSTATAPIEPAPEPER